MMDLSKKMNEFEIRKLADSFTKEDWEIIIQNQSLSEQFMRDYNGIFTRNQLWSVLTKNQTFTKAFLDDFYMKIDWSAAQSQRVSCVMLDSIEKLPIRKKILVKIEGDLSMFTDEQLQVIWDGLKYNEEIVKENGEQIDIIEYIDPNLSVEEMIQIKENLIQQAKDKAYQSLSIDDLISGNTNIKEEEQESKPIQNPKQKKKERKLETRFGTIKILDNGTYEYPTKEKVDFSDYDNEFCECKIYE